MATKTFVPAVWSARLLENLQNESVLAKLCNRNYEGDISDYGNVVHINALNAITVKTYNGTALTAEEVDATELLLNIDNAEYYNFLVRDIDAVQSKPELMDGAMRSAAYGLSDAAEAKIFTALNAGNTSTSKAITKSNAYETVVDLKTAMDEANAPKNGRWLVVPPKFEGIMLKDERFVVYTDGANSRLEKGAVAKVAGFDVYVSNNVSGAIVAGHADGVTYADQIVQTEAYRQEAGFADGVKGLHVYGVKVTRPTIIIPQTVTF